MSATRLGMPGCAAFGERMMRWRASFVGVVLWGLLAGVPTAAGAAEPDVAMVRVPAQFIAALGAPGARSGDNAAEWGLWTVDPGNRGVDLDRYPILVREGGLASAGWRFDGEDWWLEEHGLIMEQPVFPVPPRRYRVTGDRGTQAILSVSAPDASGRMRWRLSDGATLHDVTHLACRAARYRPAAGARSCTPARADPTQFPVDPGAEMPAVAGCAKQDYAVLIVIGVEAAGR
ncbi:MAG: hypothetical protein R3E48_22505 [Burkholderiaceae bacterium]